MQSVETLHVLNLRSTMQIDCMHIHVQLYSSTKFSTAVPRHGMHISILWYIY